MKKKDGERKKARESQSANSFSSALFRAERIKQGAPEGRAWNAAHFHAHGHTHPHGDSPPA